MPGVQNSGRFDIGDERKPSQATERHQFEGAFNSVEPQSVETIAASNGNSHVREVDAPSASWSGTELQVVSAPLAVKRTERPRRRGGTPLEESHRFRTMDHTTCESLSKFRTDVINRQMRRNWSHGRTAIMAA